MCGRYISSFLNTEGGTLFFGIDDNGFVVGCDLTRKDMDEFRTILSQTLRRFTPQVFDSMYQVTYEGVANQHGYDTGRVVIEVSVQKGNEEELYFLSDGRVFAKRDGAKDNLRPFDVWGIAKRKLALRREENERLQAQISGIFQDSFEPLTGKLRAMGDTELERIRSEYETKLARYKKVVSHLENSLEEISRERETRSLLSVAQLSRENEELRRKLRESSLASSSSSSVSSPKSVPAVQGQSTVTPDRQISRRNSTGSTDDLVVSVSLPPSALAHKRSLSADGKKDPKPPKTERAVPTPPVSAPPASAAPPKKKNRFPVHIGNLPANLKAHDLLAMFNRFGEIESIVLASDKNCAFVNFADQNAALKACQGMNNAEVYGSAISVTPRVKPRGRKGNISPDLSFLVWDSIRNF